MRPRRAPWIALLLLLATACVTPASTWTTPSATATTLMYGWERHFSLDWTVELEGGARRIRGHAENKHGEYALNVRLLAQALDESGGVVGQRIEWIPGGIAGFSRAYFEVPRLPAAASYRVSVWEYTWLQSDGDKR